MKKFLFFLFFFLATFAEAQRAIQLDMLLAGLTDESGNPLSGGKVYSYAAGTSTPIPLFLDQTTSTPATNPVILDSRGRAQVFGNAVYKLIVTDENDVTQYAIDNLSYFIPPLQAVYAGTSTGSSNAYAITPSPAIISLVDGQVYSFIANHATSGAATLNVSGLGVRNFVAADGTTNLTTGSIVVNQPVDARYIAGSDHFRLISSAGVQAVSAGGTGSSTAGGARTNLGLGDLAVKNTVNNADWSGTALAVANGGTGSTTQSGARTALGLGSLATLSTVNNSNWSGTALAVANGGTGVTTSAGIRAIVLGSDIDRTTNNLSPTAPGGANLGDSTNDWNGLRVRAIAPISGQTVKYWGNNSLTYGMEFNADLTVIGLKPIGTTSTLGDTSSRWGTLFTTDPVNVSSDRRLKSNIEDINSSLATLKKLEPKKYIKNEKPEFGFIAQDVYEHIPEIVSKGDEEIMWGMSYEQLIPFLVGAIKELDQKVKELESANCQGSSQ